MRLAIMLLFSLAASAQVSAPGTAYVAPLCSFSSSAAAICTGTYYVDNVNGSDTNSGTTPLAPFKTIAHINSLTLAPGQTVAFKSGDIFYEQLTIAQSGNAARPITFTSYGSGAYPVISANSLTTGWVNSSGNIWKVSAASSPGFPDFAGQPGIPVASSAAVTAPTDWFWDGSAELYVYSLFAPTATVEIAARTNAITSAGASYINIAGLEIRGGTDALYCGVAVACSYWNVTNNRFDSAYSDGIHFAFNTGVSTVNNVFKGNTFQGFGSTPVSVGNGGAAQNLIVSYNSMSNVCQIYVSASAENAFCDGVQVFSQTQADGGQYIGYNYVVNSGIPGGLSATQYGGGFHCDTVINCVIEHNVAISTSNPGVNVEKNLTAMAQYNLMVNSGQYQYTPSLNLTAGAGYNESNVTAQFNTVTGTLQYWSCTGGQNSNTLTNQIFQYNICGGTPSGGQTLYWDASYSGTGNTWTYNNFGAAASCFVNLNSTCYATYGAVPTPVGTTVLQGAPVYTNASGSDYTQTSSSPTLGIGAFPYQITAPSFTGPWPNPSTQAPYNNWPTHR